MATSLASGDGASGLKSAGDSVPPTLRALGDLHSARCPNWLLRSCCRVRFDVSQQHPRRAATQGGGRLVLLENPARLGREPQQGICALARSLRRWNGGRVQSPVATRLRYTDGIGLGYAGVVRRVSLGEVTVVELKYTAALQAHCSAGACARCSKAKRRKTRPAALMRLYGSFQLGFGGTRGAAKNPQTLKTLRNPLSTLVS